MAEGKQEVEHEREEESHLGTIEKTLREERGERRREINAHEESGGKNINVDQAEKRIHQKNVYSEEKESISFLR